MTNEEIKIGIDNLQFTIEMFLFDPSTGEMKTYESLNDDDKYTVDGCLVGIKALEKAKKYAWHDLRKDQSDLPNLDDDIIIEYERMSDETVGKIHIAYKVDNSCLMNLKNGTFNDFVFLAWRYIEPFEED